METRASDLAGVVDESGDGARREIQRSATSACFSRTILRSATFIHAAAAAVVAVFAMLLDWERAEDLADVGTTVVLRPRFVTDGCTFYGTTPTGKLMRVRLRLVVSPQLNEPFGPEARNHLRELLLPTEAGAEKRVQCHISGVEDKVGVFADAFLSADEGASQADNNTGSPLINVQESMVRSGWAWAMETEFFPNPRLVALMEEARSARRGLWRDEKFVPPSKRSWGNHWGAVHNEDAESRRRKEHVRHRFQCRLQRRSD
ncbi:hypothetical protein TRVL_08859 [Trypanosoma vivax]|nr:hypothetical protein TRVL_08859 [Trypanosoma vivax]